MSGSNQAAAAPSGFCFAVTGIPGSPVFQEIAGLDGDAGVPEYRVGDGKAFTSVRAPGSAKARNVTMKQGRFVDGGQLGAWFGSIEANTVPRGTITVQLMDQAGRALRTWTLHDAFPVKLERANLDADGDGGAVETIEVACGAVTVSGA